PRRLHLRHRQILLLRRGLQETMKKSILALIVLIVGFLVVASLFPLRGQQAPQVIQVPVPGTTVTTPPQQVQVPATTVTAPGQQAIVPPGVISVTAALTGLPSNCSVSWNLSGTAITGAVTCTTVAPLKITSPIALPSAKVGTFYSTDLNRLAAPTGGIPPYSYALGSDAPSWATITPAGSLPGTPPATGNLSFSFVVSDSGGTGIANNLRLRTSKGGR